MKVIKIVKLGFMKSRSLVSTADWNYDHNNYLILTNGWLFGSFIK